MLDRHNPKRWQMVRRSHQLRDPSQPERMNLAHRLDGAFGAAIDKLVQIGVA